MQPTARNRLIFMSSEMTTPRLDEVRVRDTRDFGRTEIRRIQKLIEDKQEELLSWHEYFGN